MASRPRRPNRTGQRVHPRILKAGLWKWEELSTAKLIARSAAQEGKEQLMSSTTGPDRAQTCIIGLTGRACSMPGQ